METTGQVAWGEVRGGEQPTRGIGQKIRGAKKRVKADGAWGTEPSKADIPERVAFDVIDCARQLSLDGGQRVRHRLVIRHPASRAA
jgi:hypothetical protein